MYIPITSKIKEKRIKIGLKASQLSKKAGLPANAIGRIERNENKFTHPIRAKAIALALDCDINEVFKIVDN